MMTIFYKLKPDYLVSPLIHNIRVLAKKTKNRERVNKGGVCSCFHF